MGTKYILIILGQWVQTNISLGKSGHTVPLLIHNTGLNRTVHRRQVLKGQHPLSFLPSAFTLNPCLNLAHSPVDHCHPLCARRTATHLFSQRFVSSSHTPGPGARFWGAKDEWHHWPLWGCRLVGCGGLKSIPLTFISTQNMTSFESLQM